MNYDDDDDENTVNVSFSLVFAFDRSSRNREQLFLFCIGIGEEFSVQSSQSPLRGSEMNAHLHPGTHSPRTPEADSFFQHTGLWEVAKFFGFGGV